MTQAETKYCGFCNTKGHTDLECNSRPLDASTNAPKIYQAIAACMGEINAIGKARKNTQQGYNFRGIDDVYNELHDVLAKHGVFTVPFVMEDRTEERTTNKGAALIYRVLKIHFTFYAADGSNVSACVMGEGMDSGDKASNKAMAVAHKYALMQVFCIPTEDAKDPENDSHEIRPRSEPRPPAPEAVFDPANKMMIERITARLKTSGIAHDEASLSRITAALKGIPLSGVSAKLQELTNGTVE